MSCANARGSGIGGVRAGTLLIGMLLCTSTAIHAQPRTGCQAPQRPSIGVAVGRALPYFEPASSILGSSQGGSLSVDSATQVAGRTDLPLVGRLRVRVEGALSRWPIRQTSYGDNLEVIDEATPGSFSARHLVALVGVRVGRAPACAHVSVGGGLHVLGFRGSSLRGPGFAVAGGFEIPTASRGAFQFDATVHMISLGDGLPPTNSSGALNLSLLAGWAYRF